MFLTTREEPFTELFIPENNMKKITISLFFSAAFTIFLFAQTSNPSVENGKKLYEKYCLACHQADGSGVPKMNPPLIKTSYTTGDKKKIIQWVLRGSVENIPIDDRTYSNNMPPQDSLKDEEIAEILTYVRSSFGNRASAVTATDVKNVRAVTKLN
jgi:mono/diheme cytochrome c family protein